MLRYARHLLGPTHDAREHDAQDLVQDALLRLHRQWAQHGRDSVTHIRTWLLRVTHNLAIDAIRKKGRRRMSLPKLQRAAEDRAEVQAHSQGLLDVENREAAEYAKRLMNDLPENQQRVLTLRLNDMTIRQIGEVLDMSPGNVGYHLNQALGTLARQLKQAGVV